MNRREFFFSATAVPFLKPKTLGPPLKLKYLETTIPVPINVSAEEWNASLDRIVDEIGKEMRRHTYRIVGPRRIDTWENFES